MNTCCRCKNATAHLVAYNYDGSYWRGFCDTCLDHYQRLTSALMVNIKVMAYQK